MNDINKKAFTLVELIVVITILAILWTISMLAFQGYTVSARDSVRVYDLNNIKSAIEYTRIENGTYITPDNWVDITYSGSIAVWNQGVFWDEAKRKTQRLDKVPVDPLTQDEYTFSVTSNGWEFELGAIMEWDDVAYGSPSILDSTYAATSFRAFINGTYNGKIAKASSGWYDYVFAVPSIISSELWTPTISYITTNNKLVMKWYENLPASYNNTTNWSTTLLERDFINEDDIVVFSWSFDTLKKDESWLEQVLFLSNLQKAYSGTVIQDNSEIKQILDVDTLDNKEWAKFLTQTFIKSTLDRKFQVTAINNVNTEKLTIDSMCHGSDYTNSYNTNNGFYNNNIYPNSYAYATLNSSWWIEVWWNSNTGWSNQPTEEDYVYIASNDQAFTWIKSDGSLASWWNSSYWATWFPTGSWFTSISSTKYAFAALKSDGSIEAWWNTGYGGSGEPSDDGYVSIYSNNDAFAAMKADWSISVWWRAYSGWDNGPIGSWYTQIFSSGWAFAALKADGAITTWWQSWWWGTWGPTGAWYTRIFSNYFGFAVIDSDGGITSWWNPTYGWIGEPTDTWYTTIVPNHYSFSALKSDGSIVNWGDLAYGGTSYWVEPAPTDNGYVSIYAWPNSFVALKWDGSISSWWNRANGWLWAPSDNGYIKIYTTYWAFAAMKADGSISAWWSSLSWWNWAPTDSWYSAIVTNSQSFAAMKHDGTISAWWSYTNWRTWFPTDAWYSMINWVCN